MLAGKFREEKVALKLPLHGQIKYDGIRVFIRDGVAYTRSLKPVRAQEFQSWVAWNRELLEGMDGEIICGEPTAPDCYRRTMQFVMSYDAPDEFTFYTFDKWDEPLEFHDRLTHVENTEKIFTQNTDGPPLFVMAETIELTTMEEVWKFHEDKILEGHEGIILRDPHSFYKFGRGSPVQCECIKMKEGGWVDTEVRIIDWHEQMHNANEAKLDALGHTERSGHKENLIGKDTLGALEVKGNFVKDGKPFTCRVGTGLDDEIRALFWANPDAYKDKFVKIKYFEVGIKDKPRFPTFLGFRDPDDMDMKQGDLFSD